MEGGFYVVCHIDFKSVSMGNGSALSIMGYDTDAKGYTYREFNSWGEFENAKGSLDGDTWTWGGDEKFGKGRFTMKITSPTTYNFTSKCHRTARPGRQSWTAKPPRSSPA